MAKYSAVKATVNAYIKQNGRKEITGRILNAVLNATIDSLGKYFQFAGGALPTDDPGTPDQNVCYLAGEPGVYTNFGGITIENEEVALLFWDGEWTKQRILIGIREVNASVDNQVGTPSVDVSYSGGELVLTFHNLKGDQGDTGDPAGFGTIGADINGGVGTPGVSVETSGDNTAKNLMFHFTNLKGETGVTSVVATIDDTSGTPSCQVSLVGQQLTLAFSGLKGLKGDTGVSADYPITIYNGLDSDATDQALSAAQGKVLDGKVSQLAQEVYVYPDIPINATANGWELIGSVGLCGQDNSMKLVKYLVTAGSKIYLNLSKDGEVVYQFQSVASVPASGQSNPNLVGSSVKETTNTIVIVPSGATYLIVSAAETNTTNVVKEVDYNKTKFDSLDKVLNGITIESSVVPGAYTHVILADYGISGGDTINVTNSGTTILGIEIRDANNTTTIVNETVTAGTNRNITLPTDAGRLRLYSSASLTATIKTNTGLKKDVSILQSAVSQNTENIERLDLAVNGTSADVVVVPNSYTIVQLEDLKSSAGDSLHFVNSGTTLVSVEFRDSGNTTTLLSKVIPNGGELDVTIPSGASFIRMGSSQNAPVKVIAAEGLDDKLESFVPAETILTKSFNSSFHIGAENWEGKAKEYTDLFNDSAENEAFLFFTDPHFFTRDDNIWKKRMPEFIAEIQKYYNSTPASFCISGGDWLTARDSNEVAKFRLGYVDGIMRSMFKEYYPVFGNHDDNYQGASEDGGEAATGTPLSKQTIVNLWFRGFKKAYYDFEGMASRVYVFDSGNDWRPEMSEYRWEQVSWFANNILTNNDKHIVIVTHIAYNSNEDASGNTLFPLTDYIAQIAQAYNNRSAITVNGITYDFNNAQGRVEFILSGHMHRDIVQNKYGLPIICTINTLVDTTGPSFDLMYVDYDNRIINCIRVGSGSNRVVNL